MARCVKFTHRHDTGAMKGGFAAHGTHFAKPNQPTVIAKGDHPHLSLRGVAAHGEPVEPRGNLVEVEHTPGNHHCYGVEIATPVSSTGSQ